ncbi:ribonuclease E inhibitor RraB [Ferrimonas lipolytica]|uniref:Regulator of ribonuclease activity B n=1 Tax=Ferrimonas lipolytica TaxID=2724191 RepID=A0A6H1UJA6_9GAMM|nr:ribonuclease E inhibitor RraB [Ferrimonas lipolytica]QIZ78908.1 ribonuclease E inhibitor RraB [Ferrimonas lipolytica]
MTADQLIKEQQMETREIVQALLEDGSKEDAIYSIEHHFASEDFDALEKAAVDVYKAGFEVEDAEEIELEDGDIAYCFSAVVDHELKVERLDKDCAQLIALAEKHKVLYDGWGTHFVEQGE